jgi:excisionase family DNA binding protein
MEEHDLMKTEEVAARLRLSRMTVIRMIHAGKLDAIRAGRSFRVKRASVQKMLDGGGE